VINAAVVGMHPGDNHFVFDHMPTEAVWHPDWKPLELATSGELVDYQPSHLGASLCSDRMRRLIDDNKGPLDVIEWLPVTVNGHPYWVMNFPERAPVLDEKRTLAFHGAVAKPVLVRALIGERHIFSYPGGGQETVVLSKQMKDLLERHCTNVEFSKVEVV
jgi:hypothetical protein